jgi:hypothetical protein
MIDVSIDVCGARFQAIFPVFFVERYRTCEYFRKT